MNPEPFPTPLLTRDGRTFPEAIADLEQALGELKQVYDLCAQSPQSPRQNQKLLQQLARAEGELTDLDVELAAHLYPSGLRELFWQIVRFTGLGIILGWMLRSWGA